MHGYWVVGQMEFSSSLVCTLNSTEHRARQHEHSRDSDDAIDNVSDEGDDEKVGDEATDTDVDDDSSDEPDGNGFWFRTDS